MIELIYNGNIISMNNKESIYHWIYVKDGLIKDLGCYDGYKRYIDKCKNTLDLEGKTVLPGFIDSHVYMIQTGLNMMAVDLSKAKSIEEVIALLKERKNKTPKGHLIRGVKFDELNVNEKRFPTRKELDKEFPEHPVWINRIEMHTSMINSMGLTLTKIPFNLPGIERKNDILTGIIKDRANAFIRNYFYSDMTDDLREKALKKSEAYALACGVTTINAIESGFAFSDKDGDFLNQKKDKLKVDVALFYQTLDLQKIIALELPRVGCIFLDGSIGSRTAAVSKAYDDEEDNFGSLYYGEKHLKSFILEAHKKDFQIAIHAVGDRAIDLALDAFEEALTLYPNENHRHRIEHFELPSIRAIRRMASLGIIAMMVPNAGYNWSKEGAAYDIRLDQKRVDNNNPIATMLQHGIKIAAGSDCDITDMNPFLGIHALVNSDNPIRKTTLSDALKLYTLNGAYAIEEEHCKGSIEKSKLADLVILSANPYECEIDRLREIEVKLTIKNGRLVYSKEDE